MTEPIDRNDVLTETEQENRELKERFNKTIQINLNLLSKITSLESQLEEARQWVEGNTKASNKLALEVVDLQLRLSTVERENADLATQNIRLLNALDSSLTPLGIDEKFPARSERDTGETEIK